VINGEGGERYGWALLILERRVFGQAQKERKSLLSGIKGEKGKKKNQLWGVITDGMRIFCKFQLANKKKRGGGGGGGGGLTGQATW